MEFILSLLEKIAALPLWCLVLPPAALIAAAIPLCLLKKRRLYLWCCLLFGAVGSIFTLHDRALHLFYLALYLILALLLFPLFFVRKKKSAKHGEEALHARFREEAKPYPVPAKEERSLPPKICCFEDPPSATAEERGMRLTHVTALIEKLKREKLSPADRLEVEMLARNVEESRDRPLTDVQTDALNDSLAAVLRLVAKYS